MPKLPRRLHLSTLLGLTMAVWGALSLGMIIHGYATGGELGLFAVALPFISWAAMMPFAAGTGFLVGALAALAGRMPWRDYGFFLCLFFLPFAILIGAGWLIQAMAPGTSAENDLATAFGAMASPVSFLVYLGAWTVARAQDPARPWRGFSATLALPLLASIASFVLLTASLSRTAEFQYAGKFVPSLERAVLNENGLEVELALALEEAGDFEYSAIYLETAGGSSGMRARTLRWSAGGPPQQPGVHGLSLSFPGLEMNPAASSRIIRFEIRGPVANRSGYRPPLHREDLDLEGRLPVSSP